MFESLIAELQPRENAPLVRIFMFQINERIRDQLEAEVSASPQGLLLFNPTRLAAAMEDWVSAELDELDVSQPGTAPTSGVPGADEREGTARWAGANIQLWLPEKPLWLPEKPLTPVQRRLLAQSWTEGDERLAFQHTVFCQTSLPYRNPGNDVRLWERKQGAVLLQIKAGQVANPATHGMVEVGLPWGTKPRLILAHLNAEALRQNSPEIEVGNSLTAFVKRVRGFEAGGREIRAFRNQLKRLSASDVRLVFFRDKHAQQIETRIITAFDLWPELDVRQRALWPSVIHLSQRYFEDLKEHAVPLNEADLRALAHSAVALDLYFWLAQRLHRIDESKPQFIPWTALKGQFGPDFGRMDNFKRSFRTTLRTVLARYLDARIELNDRGMTGRHSPPPVPPRYVLGPKLG